MKKIFKMTLFKKIFFTTLIGLVIILASFMYVTFLVEKDHIIDDYFDDFVNLYSYEEVKKIFSESLENPEKEYSKALEIISSNEFNNQFQQVTDGRWYGDIIITRFNVQWSDSSIYPDKELLLTTFDYEYEFIELDGKNYSLEYLPIKEKESLLNYFINNYKYSDEVEDLKSFSYCIDDNQISYLKWENNEYGKSNGDVRQEFVGAEFYLLDYCIRNEAGSDGVIINIKKLEEALQSVNFLYTHGTKGRNLIEIDDTTYFISGGYIAGDTDSETGDVINIFSIEIKKDLNKEVFEISFERFKVVYLFAFILVLFLSWCLSVILVYPIRQLEVSAHNISNNEFDQEIKVKSNDEIGSLAKSIDVMRINLKETVGKLNHEIEHVKELESLRKDFINQFTHEMKTPLGIINGYSELIEETENEEEKEKYLDIINRETVRINELIQSMLKLSRLEAGKVELNKEALDLEDIVTEIVDEYEVLLMKKNIKVEVITNNKHIIGDRNQIITVIRNFLSNAIKHTETKIIITIEKGISIYNEGELIEEDRLDSIWYTFVTHDKSGSGLGLAICRGILELHEYDYGVNNKDNGVEFYFYE